MSSNGIREYLRSLAQPFTYLGLAMLAFIYIAVAYLIIHDRDEAYASAARRGGNVVRIIEQSFSHLFESVDARILFLRKSYQQDPLTFDIAAWTNDPSIKNDLTLDFNIVDANGRLQDSTTLKDSLGADLSDREPYYVHINSTTDQLFVGKTSPLKIRGNRGLVLSRRITAPDGSFAGTIAAIIDPVVLARQIGMVELGKDGTIALIGFDGNIRTRVVNGKVSNADLGRTIPKGVGVLGPAEKAGSGQYWNVPGITENVRRLVSYRVLESYPLIALVTIAESEVYAQADKNAHSYAIIALMLTVAILVAIWFGAARERKLIATSSKAKEAQEALLQSQERYKLVESAVNDGIWDWNIVTDDDYLSPRWKSMLGYDDDDIPNRKSAFFDLVHPDDLPAVREATRAHLEDGKPYSLEYRLRCKDGEHRWVHSRGRVVRDASNRPIRMVGTNADITERKEAQSSIEEARKYLARAEEIALLGHVRIERKSEVINWSDGVYRIMGKSRGSFTPTLDSVLEILYPDDRSILLQYRLDIMSGRDVPPVTVRMVRNDGEIIDVEFSAAPIRAKDGVVTGLFGTIQDVSARNRAARALEQANQELERRVAERTAELAEELRQREEAQMKLAQVQKMDAVGQLTAGVAHDFNNLLAVIGASLEFIERAAAQSLPAEPELIEASLRASRRGRELVQRLLTFARQSPLRAEPTIVDQLVLDTLRLVQRSLGESVEIEIQLNAAAANVYVDRSQLANALVNLALNARDAMPEGGRLTIATTCRPAQWAAVDGTERWPTGEEVCVTISDTGVGMTDEVRIRAFEPFFTTKQSGLGSGLGLSMVHGFVEQSGGHIVIDSAPEVGTTVTIRLPRIEPVSSEYDVRSIAETPANGNERTVLLVEDDPDVRIVTKAQLRKLGYNVFAVSNGLEAMDLIESPAVIDVTLTDIVLPAGIDGVRLVKEALRARPTMGVLCMSGYDPTKKHRKWLEVQNIELLEKPFSMTRLAEALEKAIA